MAEQRDLAASLLTLAGDDKAAARTLLTADAPPAIAGFHCQQAVEKALKAVLADRGGAFPHTHNLGLLVQLCDDAGAAPPESLSEIDRLTPFAVQIRYGTSHSPAVDLATAVAWAEQTLVWSVATVSSGP